MSLEERLAQMRAAEEQRKALLTQQQKEAELLALRTEISEATGERERLEALRTELTEGQNQLRGSVATVREHRGRILSLLSRNRDLLKGMGVYTIPELMRFDVFRDDEEVASYRDAKLGLHGKTSELLSTKRRARAALVEHTTEDEATHTEGQETPSEIPLTQQTLLSELSRVIDAVNAKLEELEAQTPEARAERERKQALFDRVSRRRRPRMDNDRDNRRSVFAEDLSEAEHDVGGEEAVREAIIRQMSEQVDQAVVEKQKEDGIPELAEDLKLLEENRRFFEEAEVAFRRTKNNYQRAIAHLAPQASRDWVPEEWARRQIEIVVGRRLDTPQTRSGRSGELSRRYLDYVLSMDKNFSSVVGSRDGHHLERGWGNGPKWRTEDFCATLEQINRIDEVLENLVTLDSAQIKGLEETSVSYEAPAPLGSNPNLKLHDQTMEQLFQRGSVERIAEVVRNRQERDDERTRRLKDAIHGRVDRDWKEAVYLEFENDPHTKEVIKRLAERERDLPLAREVLPMIDVLRRNISEHPDFVVNFTRGWGAVGGVEVPPTQDIERNYEAWQEVVRRNERTLRSLGEKRQDLRDARGLTQVMERRRIQREITELENQLVDEDEVSQLGQKYHKADDWRRDVEQRVRELWSKITSNRNVDQNETLQLTDWIDQQDTRFRPILESKVSAEDQAILDRHRDFERRRNSGYWAT